MDQKTAAFKYASEKRNDPQTRKIKCSWLRDVCYIDLYSIVLE